MDLFDWRSILNCISPLPGAANGAGNKPKPRNKAESRVMEIAMEMRGSEENSGSVKTSSLGSLRQRVVVKDPNLTNSSDYEMRTSEKQSISPLTVHSAPQQEKQASPVPRSSDEEEAFFSADTIELEEEGSELVASRSPNSSSFRSHLSSPIVTEAVTEEITEKQKKRLKRIENRVAACQQNILTVRDSVRKSEREGRMTGVLLDQIDAIIAKISRIQARIEKGAKHAEAGTYLAKGYQKMMKRAAEAKREFEDASDLVKKALKAQYQSITAGTAELVKSEDCKKQNKVEQFKAFVRAQMQGSSS